MKSWVKTPTDFINRISAAVLTHPTCDPWLLHLAATAWCRENSRDGIIPASELTKLAFWSKSGPSPADVAATLVEAGLWAADGYSFHLLDYADQAVPVEISQARAEAGRNGGFASGNARSSMRIARIDQSKQTKQTEANEAKVSKRSDENRVDERRGDGDGDAYPISPPPASPDAGLKTSPRKEPTNDGARLGEAFREVYIARFSAEPEIQKQHYVRASAHTKRVGLDEALRRLAIYLDDEKCPYGKRGQKAFGTFLAVFDECAAPRAGSKADPPQREWGDPGYDATETPGVPAFEVSSWET